MAARLKIDVDDNSGAALVAFDKRLAIIEEQLALTRAQTELLNDQQQRQEIIVRRTSASWFEYGRVLGFVGHHVVKTSEEMAGHAGLHIAAEKSSAALGFLTRMTARLGAKAAGVTAPIGLLTATLLAEKKVLEETGEQAKVMDDLTDAEKRAAEELIRLNNESVERLKTAAAAQGKTLDELGIKTENNLDRIKSSLGGLTDRFLEPVNDIGTGIKQWWNSTNIFRDAWEKVDTVVSDQVTDLENKVGALGHAWDTLVNSMEAAGPKTLDEVERLQEVRHAAEKAAESLERMNKAARPRVEAEKRFREDLDRRLKLESDLAEINKLSSADAAGRLQKIKDEINALIFRERELTAAQKQRLTDLHRLQEAATRRRVEAVKEAAEKERKIREEAAAKERQHREQTLREEMKRRQAAEETHQQQLAEIRQRWAAVQREHRAQTTLEIRNERIALEQEILDRVAARIDAETEDEKEKAKLLGDIERRRLVQTKKRIKEEARARFDATDDEIEKRKLAAETVRKLRQAEFDTNRKIRDLEFQAEQVLRNKQREADKERREQAIADARDQFQQEVALLKQKLLEEQKLKGGASTSGIGQLAQRITPRQLVEELVRRREAAGATTRTGRKATTNELRSVVVGQLRRGQIARNEIAKAQLNIIGQTARQGFQTGKLSRATAQGLLEAAQSINKNIQETEANAKKIENIEKSLKATADAAQRRRNQRRGNGR